MYFLIALETIASLFCLKIALFCAPSHALTIPELEELGKTIVIATKRINLTDFPGAFNPSLIKTDKNYLLTFRYCPDHYYCPSLNYIGVVLLDEKFDPISEPQLLNTRIKGSPTVSQAEDARIFSYRERLFLIYNDNIEINSPNINQRRDMFMAELSYANDHFVLSAPLKLVYGEKYHTAWWQKNWVPFEWNKNLMLIYSTHPHEIIFPNLTSGECYSCYQTQAAFAWDWGKLRGSTPPQLDDGEYWAFFHSSLQTSSPCSLNQNLWHYFAGVYTFSAEPPFEMKKMLPFPIVAEGFYTFSPSLKKVIFPGGFVISNSSIYLAYGKDDAEIWIATIDKNALKKAMVSLSPKN